MRIALYQPDIAGNVGTILRTAACFGVGIDLIEPMGFAFSDRALGRAGMDYVPAVLVKRHIDWTAFEAQVAGRIVLLTTRGGIRLDAARFAADDVLLMGSEGSGMRSLNVAVATGIALGEALRQTGGYPA